MKSPFPATALALLAGLGAAALGFPVLGLYYRIDKPRALDAETRRRVYEHLARSPGLTAAEIAALEGFDRKTAAHHARLLHHHALLEAEKDGRTVRYFLPGDRARRPPASGVAADILRLALDEPGLTQTEAAARLEVCRATVQWHARRLADRGLLERGALRVPREKQATLRDALTRPASWPAT